MVLVKVCGCDELALRILLPHMFFIVTASAQSDQSSQGTLWVAKDVKRLQADSED